MSTLSLVLSVSDMMNSSGKAVKWGIITNIS
jgi:hypothetical protein